MRKSKIKYKDVSTANETKKIDLPKYSSQIINLANCYSKATKPENVGQVSEEIKKFREDETLGGYSNQDWINWHKNKYPNGIQNATDVAWKKFQEMLESLKKVTRDHIQKWEEDLVYSKTYDGLMVQKAIIIQIAKELETDCYRLAKPEEERQGIDGFINNHPIQIKSDTYDRAGKLHNEDMQCVVVSYTKSNKTICFEYNEDDFKL